MLTAEAIADIESIYVRDDPEAYKSPKVSPLRAKSFAGLAPAVIGTAQYDPLRDEGLAYAKALEAAGVDVFVRNYDSLIHSFLNLFAISPAADAATGELFTQLRQRLE